MAKPSRNFKTKLKDAFDFTMSEIRGMIVLIILLCLLISITCTISYISVHKQWKADKDKSAEIDNFFAYQQYLQDSIAKNKFLTPSYQQQQQLKPFLFCPDTMKTNDWLKMGFSKKKAEQINNYLSKGGKIHTAEDLKKIYCINEQEYQQIKNYVQIKPSSPRSDTRSKEYFNKNNISKMYDISLNINTEDSIGLQRIPGIGPKIAGRIINYRNKLGGYYSVDQLKEVYGIDSLKYEQIKTYFYIDSADITLININTADIKTMVKHPYIDYFIAKSLVIYRDKHGDFSSVQDIKKAVHFYDELYNKLLPYLTI